MRNKREKRAQTSTEKSAQRAHKPEAFRKRCSALPQRDFKKHKFSKQWMMYANSLPCDDSKFPRSGGKKGGKRSTSSTNRGLHLGTIQLNPAL